jgi:hypothetical protein
MAKEWRPVTYGREVGDARKVQLTVFRLVHHTHAAAQFLADGVVRDGLADHVQNMLWRASRQVNESGGVRPRSQVSWRKIALSQACAFLRLSGEQKAQSCAMAC